MNFKEAQKFRVPLGEFCLKTLDDACYTDYGLLKMNWFLKQPFIKIEYPDFYNALSVYFEHPDVMKDLEEIEKKLNKDTQNEEEVS